MPNVDLNGNYHEVHQRLWKEIVFSVQWEDYASIYKVPTQEKN